jgi:ATP-dependent DNA helicase PIF1
MNWLNLVKDGEIEPTWIKIPHELLMPRQDAIQCMMNSAYPNLCGNYTDMEYLNKRAILTPTNDAVDTINDYVVFILPGDAKEYLSCDKISKTPDTHDSYDLLYPIEFLNSLNANKFHIIS